MGLDETGGIVVGVTGEGQSLSGIGDTLHARRRQRHDAHFDAGAVHLEDTSIGINESAFDSLA
jgi:hypothetical protein